MWNNTIRYKDLILLTQMKHIDSTPFLCFSTQIKQIESTVFLLRGYYLSGIFRALICTERGPGMPSLTRETLCCAGVSPCRPQTLGLLVGSGARDAIGNDNKHQRGRGRGFPKIRVISPILHWFRAVPSPASHQRQEGGGHVGPTFNLLR